MQNFIYTLLICSVTMSALSVLFMLLSPLLSKRYGAKWQYYAWLIIIAGFIVPFRPHFDVGIFTIPVPASLIQDEITDIAVHEDISSAKKSMDIPEKYTKDSPGLSVRESITNIPASMDTTDIFERDNNEELTAAISPNHIRKLSVYEISFIVFIIWITGVVIVLGYNLLKHRRLMKTVNRWKDDISDMRTLDILQQQKETLGIRKDVSIQLYPLIAGSMLAGLTKPAILLQTTQYSDEELSFIIIHELIHFKHKDLFFKILVLTAKALHWFNPVVYLTARAVSVQCEKACDEAVICNAGTAVRKRYALFIAEISKTRSGIQTALTTNFYGGKYNMKTRLLSIIDRNKKKKGIILICFTLMLTLCTSLVIAANSYTPENPANPMPDTAKEDYGEDLTDIVNDSQYHTDEAEQENIGSIQKGDTSEETETLSSSLEEAIKPYAHLGVSVDTAANLMMYEGQPVREIMDYNPVTGIVTGITESLGPGGFGGRIVSGAVDLTTVYENGVLTGLKKSTQDEYDMRTEERRLWVSPVSYEKLLKESSNAAISYEELIENIYDAPVLVEKTYSNISDITINLIVDNVVVSRGGDSVKIKYYQWTDDEYLLFDDGNGTLTLQYMASDKDNWGWVNSALEWDGRQIDPENPDANSRTIEITVPENVALQSLNIDVALGNIIINGNSGKSLLELNTIKAHTDNGDITVNGCANGQDYTIAGRQNGSVDVQNCDTAKLSVSASNGDIVISECTNGQDYTADCETGNVIVQNCGVIKLNASTRDGDISISDCTSGQDYTATCRQNGSASITNCDVKTINARALSNDITISGCTNGQDYTAYCEIGNIIVQNCDVLKLNANTRNGDILINDCKNGQDYTAVVHQNGSVAVTNCTVASASLRAVIGEINIQNSKINTATFESIINGDMTFAPNTVINPITIENSTITTASANTADRDINVLDSDVATFKINGETYNSVQNESFKVSNGIVQIIK